MPHLGCLEGKPIHEGLSVVVVAGKQGYIKLSPSISHEREQYLALRDVTLGESPVVAVLTEDAR